tara:strand:- start:261 stop:524 length:264 start_codon:yes stop_codon:yes gene_type:complete
MQPLPIISSIVYSVNQPKIDFSLLFSVQNYTFAILSSISGTFFEVCETKIFGISRPKFPNLPKGETEFGNWRSNQRLPSFFNFLFMP